MDQNRKIIYADELLNAIREDMTIRGAAFAAIMRHINAATAVEVAPVVHGRKAESVISKTGLMCTACHSDIDRDAVFCKYCGVKTDGDGNA